MYIDDIVIEEVKFKLKFTKSDYVRRIVNASPTQLVVITYEIALDYISEAKRYLEEGDDKEFRNNLSLAHEFVQQLTSNLDMSYDISWELMSIYLYTGKLLSQSGASNETIHLDNASEILNNLLTSWHELEKLDGIESPALENAQQVFAGLTYGRDGLDEFVMDDNSRGFKA